MKLEMRKREAAEAASSAAAIVSSTADAILSKTLDGAIKSCNAAATRLFGYSADELIGQNIALLYPPERLEELKMILARIGRGESIDQYETTRVARDGRRLDVSVTISPIKDATGDVVGASKVVRDITDHKRAERDLRDALREVSDLRAALDARTIVEARLRDSELRLRIAFANSAIGFAMATVDGEFVEANDAYCRTVGYSLDELRSLTSPQLIHPDDRPANMAMAGLLMAGEIPGFIVENRYLHKSGDVIWVRKSVSITTDSSGRRRWFVYLIEDVTERRRIAQALFESRLRTRLATEATGVGIWERHLATDRVSWDAQMFRLYGMAPTEDGFVHYNDWAETVLPEDLPQSDAPMRKIVQEGGSCVREFRIRRKDTGEIRHLHAVAASRANERGRIEWVVGATHDITEQKKAEEQIHFLMNEVTHRSKNLLDVVKSIALLSARQGDPVTFVADLVRRIVGLSACQDILICDKWRGVEVGDLVRAELAPFHDLGDRRLLIAGPRLRLSSKAAQGVGMALHELATNAAKYGALSNTAGCVRVDWSVAEGGETPTFVMHWREEGGPRVAPPTRKGFGQSVIVSMMELAVQGKVDVEYRETGVCWELTSPVCFTLEAA